MNYVDFILGILVGMVATFFIWIYWEMKEGRKVYEAAIKYFKEEK